MLPYNILDDVIMTIHGFRKPKSYSLAAIGKSFISDLLLSNFHITDTMGYEESIQ